MMVPKTIRFVVISVLSFMYLSPVFAQKYQASGGSVHFFSEAPLENIEATSNAAKSILNLSTGEIAFLVPIQSFHFEKSLMEEHFNENYLESDLYPSSTFSGAFKGLRMDTSWHDVTVSGELSIHGQKKKIELTGRGKIEKDSIILEANFQVRLSNYKIKIPMVVIYNIAEVVDVDVHFKYDLDEK